jgi:hypothetical protein
MTINRLGSQPFVEEVVNIAFYIIAGDRFDRHRNPDHELLQSVQIVINRVF